MKNLYIALFFGAVSTSMVAQNKDTKSADKLFNRFEYVSAVKEYMKLVDNGKADTYVYKQLADSYYNMFNATEAIKWYAKATDKSQDAESFYRYAQMLKATGKYEQANKQMQKFASLVPNDQRAKAFLENPNYIPKILEKTAKFEVKATSLSSDKSDFGAVLYDKTVYFSSARNGARKNYSWTNEPYLDIYKSILGDNGIYSEPIPVTELNTKFHDGTITISEDGNTCYFSTESFKDKAFEKVKASNSKFSQIYLYKANKSGETWTNIKMLPFNSKEYSCANPSLSRDGKTLYFSSNRPGSIGGNDIWKVEITKDGYGEPVNLGSKVNSEGNENFPFISDDGTTLFYASSGKPGLGGLDIFQIDLAKDTDAVNMGKPINTEKDDFAFTFNKKSNSGFLSSNRNGNDDIFLVTPICGVDVNVVVTNAKTGEILSNAKVAIVDEKKNVIATQTSNEKGEVSFRVECDKVYSIQATKDGFEGNIFAVAKSKGPSLNVPAPLQPIDVIVTPTEIVLNPIFFEYDKSNITQQGAFELDKLVQVMKNNEKLVIFAKSHTDKRGSDKYNLALSERRAQATVQYIISKGIPASRISGKGFGESELKVQCEPCTDEQHAQNRRSEFLIVK
ncbi:OmpA family protein [Flavobacterium aciduliphilum]|uniref:Outer membrane protein OmpA-like peptidoglycan-associated protein n=1 Tax=Flavobacterium aciduliphilum TaxID=1101402 RepID=A0A328YFX0_9FLAO|nr:OmpA family protein [Flavobacterium aciduliphilum]RAR72839.1 outer membrane protein OmpA-like peptidoglycan-associated protein [Flavobacterium aciduliphilum]